MFGLALSSRKRSAMSKVVRGDISLSLKSILYLSTRETEILARGWAARVGGGLAGNFSRLDHISA